jgi:hypothetical protein
MYVCIYIYIYIYIYACTGTTELVWNSDIAEAMRVHSSDMALSALEYRRVHAQGAIVIKRTHTQTVALHYTNVRIEKYVCISRKCTYTCIYLNTATYKHTHLSAVPAHFLKSLSSSSSSNLFQSISTCVGEPSACAEYMHVHAGMYACIQACMSVCMHVYKCVECVMHSRL